MGWATQIDASLKFDQAQPLKVWMILDDQGHASLRTVDKHDIVKQLNVRYRDLRLLDPSVSSVSLPRDHACPAGSCWASVCPFITFLHRFRSHTPPQSSYETEHSW